MAPTSRVLAIRHGESEWNVLKSQYPHEKDRYSDVMFTPDARITEKGILQSQEAGVELSTTVTEPYIMVVSPLCRALQTAQHLLSKVTRPPTGAIVVHPAAAEVMGDACDIGSPVSDLKAEFPMFGFDIVHDQWWAFGKPLQETWQLMRNKQPGGIETDEMVERRLEILRDYIQSIKTVTTVVIVTHSDIIWWLTKEFKDGEEFGYKAENGEIVDVSEFFTEATID